MATKHDEIYPISERIFAAESALRQAARSYVEASTVSTARTLREAARDFVEVADEIDEAHGRES